MSPFCCFGDDSRHCKVVEISTKRHGTQDRIFAGILRLRGPRKSVKSKNRLVYSLSRINDPKLVNNTPFPVNSSSQQSASTLVFNFNDTYLGRRNLTTPIRRPSKDT